MTGYSTEPLYQVIVKGYLFLSFAKKISIYPKRDSKLPII